MPLGRDDEHALLGQPPASEALEPRLDVIRQAGGRDVEAKLDGRRDLVDVLPPGPGGTDEGFAESAFVEGDLVSDPDHFSPRVPGRARGQARKSSRVALRPHRTPVTS